MTRQVTLLAGLHKTASTSIQRTCAANLQALRDAGFTYFVYNYEGQWETNHTRVFNGMFKRDPHKLGLQGQLNDRIAPTQQEREKLRANFAHGIRDARHLLVAAEGVSVLDVQELREMRDWFRQRDWRIPQGPVGLGGSAPGAPAENSRAGGGRYPQPPADPHHHATAPPRARARPAPGPDPVPSTGAWRRPSASYCPRTRRMSASTIMAMSCSSEVVACQPS